MGTAAGRRAIASALALATFLLFAAPQAGAERDDPTSMRRELDHLLHELTATADALDRASMRWMQARLEEIEARAAEEEVRRAFETRVRSAYIAGPGRAIDFLLSSADLHEFAARLPYATSSLALGNIDATELTARRAALEGALTDAENAQHSFSRAESRIGTVRAAIERRLARMATAAGDDAAALAEARVQNKRYAGTLDRVAGATRTIRRKRGEALYASAEPFLGPRKDCTIPKGLSSTGDRIAGEASWYGEEFRGQPTASGAWYVPERFTIAHKTLPFGLFLLVRFRGRCVVSFLNDRGPYVDGRILDLSGGSARAVGLTGVQDVSAELLVRAR